MNNHNIGNCYYNNTKKTWKIKITKKNKVQIIEEKKINRIKENNIGYFINSDNKDEIYSKAQTKRDLYISIYIYK